MTREVEMENEIFMSRLNKVSLSFIATFCIAVSVNAHSASKKAPPTKQRVHVATVQTARTGKLLAEKGSSEGKQGASGEPKDDARVEDGTLDKDKHSSAKGAAQGERASDKQGSVKDKKGFWPVIKPAKPKHVKVSTEKPAAQDASKKEKPNSEDKAIDTAGSGIGDGAAAEDKSASSSTAGSGVAPSAKIDVIEPLLPDAGLISVLKDLSRVLKDAEEVAKIENPCQKAAASVAVLALAKAVESPGLPANRIIVPGDKEKLQSAMTTESWASGDIVLSSNCHASLSAVWAKKVDGLINVAIAGNCGCRTSPIGDKLGEFVFVVNGRSSVDSGFDIQSQSNVEFWLGKLSTISADASCCNDAQVSDKTDAAQLVPALSKVSQRSTVVLKAVLTERSRNYFDRLAAIAAEKESVAAAQNAKVASRDAKLPENVEATTKDDPKLKVTSEAATGSSQAVMEARPAVISELPPDEAKTKLQTRVEDPRTTAVKSYPESSSELAFQHSAVSSDGGWDSPPPPPSTRVPSSSARVMLPDKAVAGQFLTAAVLNPNHSGESSVELSFNGAALVTGADGKALYLVPEDAIPGPSLHVGLSAQSQVPPQAISVLQPLLTPSTPQVPRIDQVSYMVPVGGTITIDGHNFDGVAVKNSVIIDGMWDARVLVASPVQLRADLPAGLLCGQHSVSVSTTGLRSNPGQFEIATVDILPDPKEVARDTLSKLIVKVNGTKNQTRIHIKNHTPEIVKISKGNDIQVLTAGGLNNVMVLEVQRLRKGAYHIGAEIR